jgi:hypothetical protein
LARQRRPGNMLNNVVKIRKSDDLRAILTDVLPYEVPLLFSNEGLYNFLQKNSASIFKDQFNIDLLSNTESTIPYNYKIKKNPTEFRALSVMHPAQQVAVAKFYKKYYGMILAQCQKSKWSLRAPTSIASYYVEKHRAQRGTQGRSTSVDLASSGFDTVSRTASSYFTYKKYSFLHKFFESSEFHDLEKRFPLLLKLDISQCFGRIYTHTIAWAVKSKEHAKANRSSVSFESAFDGLMQNSNYAETAGIIIGPEVSRIFAEIILQQIDLDIERTLLERNSPLACGEDYEIRRYVDDYFVFSKNQDNLNAIQLAISECLMPYRLSLNEAKSSCMSRPFSTAETAARIDIAAVISDVFDRAIAFTIEENPTTGESKKIYRPIRVASADRLANSTIRDIKRTLKANNTVFDTASNYFLSTTKRLVIRQISKIDTKSLDPTQLEWCTNFIISIIETIFFFYASSPRVRQTYIVSEILLLIVDYYKDVPASSASRVYTKISQEIRLATHSSSTTDQEDNIETLNLLLVLQHLGEQYSLDSASLSSTLKIKTTESGFSVPKQFSYFQAAIAIYIARDVNKYKDLKNSIIDHIVNIFDADPSWAMKSDLVMLLLDMTACPYITEAEKTRIVKAGLRHTTSQNNISKKTRDFLSLTSVHNWFINWSENVRLSDILRRKELRTPY